MERWQMETIPHHSHRTQPFSSIFFGRSHPPQSQLFPWRTLNLKPFSNSHVSCSFNNFPRWGSNAETFRPRNFNSGRRPRPDKQKRQEEEEEEPEFWSKRRWWSGEPPKIDEGSSFWEEAISSIWILEVFKSYGWLLPIILGSLFLSTGPKAFLMALALPLSQSALSLAFEKLWGRSERKPKDKYRRRRKPRSTNGTGFEEEPEANQKARAGRTGYQTWVVEENNGSADRVSREAASFGGWDDLERSRPTTRSSGMTRDAGRLSRREGKGDTPLLLRLLIAVFPFLGSWTKML